MLHASTQGAGKRRAKADKASARDSLKSELFQDILVQQDDGDAAKTALIYANALADEANGHLTALMLASINIYPIGMGEATADIWLMAQRQAETEAAALEKRLRERLSRHAPDAELRRTDVVGTDPATEFAAYSRYADAALLGWSAGGGTDSQRRMFNSALFYSGRPVMVIPENAKTLGAPRRIMVAWSPRQEATRALHDALPLMRHAEAVRIIVVDDSSTLIEKDNPGIDIAKHLARHDIVAEVKHVPKGTHGAARTLLDEAQYFGADLIVLGGYGHSRLSEWMLGGVTREMLNSCNVPMLFSH